MSKHMAGCGIDAANELGALVKKRSLAYGGAAQDFETTQKLCIEVFGLTGFSPSTIGKMLLCMKLGRIAKGGGTRDSYLDLAGYACILADMLHSEGERR